MLAFLAFSEQFGHHIAKRYRAAFLYRAERLDLAEIGPAFSLCIGARLVKFYQISPSLSRYESGRGISPPPLRDSARS